MEIIHQQQDESLHHCRWSILVTQILTDRESRCTSVLGIVSSTNDASSRWVLSARDAASSGLPLASNYTWSMFGHRADTFWHWQYRFPFSFSLDTRRDSILPSAPSRRSPNSNSIPGYSRMEIYIGYPDCSQPRISRWLVITRGDRIPAITVINLTWIFDAGKWKWAGIWSSIHWYRQIFFVVFSGDRKKRRVEQWKKNLN